MTRATVGDSRATARVAPTMDVGPAGSILFLFFLFLHSKQAGGIFIVEFEKEFYSFGFVGEGGGVFFCLSYFNLPPQEDESFFG